MRLPSRLPESRREVSPDRPARWAWSSKLEARGASLVRGCSTTAELLGLQLSVSPAFHLAGFGGCSFFALRSFAVPGSALIALSLVVAVILLCQPAVTMLSRRRCDRLLPELCWGAAHLVSSGVPLRRSLIESIGELEDPVPAELSEVSLALRYGERLESALVRFDDVSPTARFVADCLIVCEDVGGDVGAAMSLTAEALRSRTEALSTAKNRLVQARSSLVVLLALPMFGTVVVASTVDDVYANSIARLAAGVGVLALGTGAIWSHMIVRRLR